MLYISNAFSLQMLEKFRFKDGFESEISIKHVETPGAFIKPGEEFVSLVGHDDIAAVMSSILGVEVPVRRVSETLLAQDDLLVAQYVGPRLPEGAKTLPEEASIHWMHVRIRL